MSLEGEALTLWTLSACAAILVVLTLRAVLGQWLSGRARYALWLLALARLLIPAQLPIAAPVTLAGLLPESLPMSEDPFPSLPEPVPAIPGGSASVPILELAPPVAAEDITVTVSPALTPGRAAALLWAEGAAVCGGALLAFNLCFARGLRRRRRPEETPGCPLKVYRAEGLASPCLFGLFRPAIYLTPVTAALGLGEREHILAHELTHYAHGDHIWSLLRCLCLALHWYNPLVWLAAALSKRDGELACDEGAVARLGEKERLPYGRTLVGLSVRPARPADLLECSTAMTGGKKALRERVAALTRKPETRKTALFAAAALLALAAVFVFAGPPGEDGEGDCYDSFLARAEAARTLAVGEPPYSSFSSPDIVDEDLVEEARAILRRVERSPDAGAWAGADFPNIWMESRGLTLDGTYRYALYNKDGTCYVLESRTPERDSYIADDYYIVGTLPQGMTAEALGSLGRRQYARDAAVWRKEMMSSALRSFTEIQFQFPAMDVVYPAITDPDLLEQAAEVLRSGDPQDGTWQPEPDIGGALASISVRDESGGRLAHFPLSNGEMVRTLYELTMEQWERNGTE